MTLEIDRLVDTGVVELKEERVDGTIFRETRSPGQAIDDLPAEARTAIEAHWTSTRVAAYNEAIADSSPEREVGPSPVTMLEDAVADLTARVEALEAVR